MVRQGNKTKMSMSLERFWMVFRAIDFLCFCVLLTTGCCRRWMTKRFLSWSSWCLRCAALSPNSPNACNVCSNDRAHHTASHILWWAMCFLESCFIIHNRSTHYVDNYRPVTLAVLTSYNIPSASTQCLLINELNFNLIRPCRTKTEYDAYYSTHSTVYCLKLSLVW